MAELYWFPFFAKDWLSSPARMAMLPEQRGAYMDLLAIAWGNGDVEPSLLANDALLAGQSGLGARWKRLGALVLAQFTERDGKLYNAKLSEVWAEQQRKHEVAVKRGRNGGKGKADKRRSVSSSTRDEGVAQTVDAAYQSELESEGALETNSKEFVLAAPAPNSALGVEAPRASGAVGVRNPSPEPTRLGPVIDSFGEQWRNAVAVKVTQ